MKKRWLVLCVFMVCATVCVMMVLIVAHVPDDAGNYPEEIASLTKALGSGNESRAEKALREFHDEGGTIGLDCGFEFSPADLNMILRSTVDGKSALQDTKIILLSKVGGYRVNSALLAMLHDDSVSYDIALALLYCGGGADPRVGPALINALKKQMAIARSLALMRHRPAADSIRHSLQELLKQPSWWVDQRLYRQIKLEFELLSILGDRDTTALLNAALQDMLRDLASAPSADIRQEDDLGALPVFEDGMTLLSCIGGLLQTASYIWDESTLDLVASLLAAREADTYDARMGGWQKVYHAVAVALPEVGDVTAERLLAIKRQASTLEEYYISELASEECDYSRAIGIIRILAARGVTNARSPIEEYLKRNELVPWWRKMNVASYAASLGSWMGIEVLLEMAREDSVASARACEILRSVTGNAFRKNWDVWDWWLERAKAELHWDVHTNSWQPADKWEALQIEALAKLDAKSK